DGSRDGDVEGTASPGATAAEGGTGPMTCEQIRDRLDEYVDGDLAGAEFQEVELHLGGCPECRQEEREIRALVAGPPPSPRRCGRRRTCGPTSRLACA